MNILKLMNDDKSELLKYIITREKEEIRKELEKNFLGVMKTDLILKNGNSVNYILKEFNIVLDNKEKLEWYILSGKGLRSEIYKELSDENKNHINSYAKLLSKDEKIDLIKKTYKTYDVNLLIGLSLLPGFKELIIDGLDGNKEYLNNDYMFNTLDRLMVVMKGLDHYPIDMMYSAISSKWENLGTNPVSGDILDFYKHSFNVLKESEKEMLIAGSVAHKLESSLNKILKLVGKNKNNYNPIYYPLWKEVGKVTNQRGLYNILESPSLKLSDCQNKNIEDINVFTDSFFGNMVISGKFSEIEKNGTNKIKTIINNLVKADDGGFYKKEVADGKTLFDILIDNVSEAKSWVGLSGKVYKSGEVDFSNILYFMFKYRGMEDNYELLDLTWLKKDKDGLSNLRKYIDSNIVLDKEIPNMLEQKIIKSLQINQKKEILYTYIDVMKKDIEINSAGLITLGRKFKSTIFYLIDSIQESKENYWSNRDMEELGKLLEIKKLFDNVGVDFHSNNLDFILISKNKESEQLCGEKKKLKI